MLGAPAVFEQESRGMGSEGWNQSPGADRATPIQAEPNTSLSPLSEQAPQNASLETGKEQTHKCLPKASGT